jgi:hypothetical protein
MRCFIFGRSIVTDTLKLDLQSNLTYEGDAADLMLSNHTWTSCDVASFTSGPDLKYTVAIDPGNNVLISCTCSDYLQNRDNCKHMYLVNLIEAIGLKQPTPLPSTVANQEPRSEDEILFDQAVAK